jgi:hypothetical protein
MWLGVVAVVVVAGAAAREEITRYVDGVSGSDDGAGCRCSPYKTIGRALQDQPQDVKLNIHLVDHGFGSAFLLPSTNVTKPAVQIKLDASKSGLHDWPHIMDV